MRPTIVILRPNLYVNRLAKLLKHKKLDSYPSGYDILLFLKGNAQVELRGQDHQECVMDQLICTL